LDRIYSDVIMRFPPIGGWFAVLRTFNQNVLRSADGFV